MSKITQKGAMNEIFVLSQQKYKCIPNSISTVGTMCFVINSNLTKLNCPTRLTTIPSSFIYNASSLRSFTVGRNIPTIRDSAFRGLTNFDLKYEGTTAEWNLITSSSNSKSFKDCSNATVEILGDSEL